MAYTPINWQTGDTITADKLNKMDNGWGIGSTQLFSETVTTMRDQDGVYVAELNHTQLITSPTITVTFDGTEYVCRNNDSSSSIGDYGALYNEETGGFDFSTYPFNLYSSTGLPPSLSTSTDAPHTIAVVGDSIVTSTDFDTAAQKAIVSTIAELPTPFLVTIGTTTFGEVVEAIAMGKIPVIVYNNAILNQPKYIEIIVYAIWSSSVKAIKAITAISDVVEVRTYTADSRNDPIYRVTSS